MGVDSDFKSAYSKRKKGGYQWAGGFIDPSIKLGGYKEHPTMTHVQSVGRELLFKDRYSRARKAQRKLFGSEGSNF